MSFFENFISSGDPDLDSLLKFTAEIDKMTSVFRRTLLLDRSRAENDAEHSWHIAVMALIFEKYASEKVNVQHAVEMLLVHDLVEIYAGDTFAYDTAGNSDKAAREQTSADKLFSMLDNEHGTHLRNLWEEFDKRESPDAKYANCMDRIQPFLHNILTSGHTWRNGTNLPVRRQVEERMQIVRDFMPEVYIWIEKSIAVAVNKKWLAE